MKSRLIAGLTVALLLAATLACGAPTPTPLPPPTQAPPPTQPPPPPPTQAPPPTQPSAPESVELTLYNSSDTIICYVYISPVDAKEWGEDWLGPNEMIGAGGSRTFSVPAGTYDLRADDCDGNPVDVQWEVEISEGTIWTVSGTEVGLDYSLEPNFGSVDLSAGFSPDPYTVALTSGGDVNVGDYDLGDECTGYATSAPDFRLYWTGSSGNLRFFFVANVPDEDATLIVNDPNGNWHCDDDFQETFDPLVDIANPPEGQYDIWVGSFEAGAFVEGTLYITEMDFSPTNLPSGGALPSGTVLLQDDFSDPNSGWETGDYDGGSLRYAGGAYAVVSTQEGRMMWGVANRNFADLVIDVDATQIVAPSNDNNGYGVFCRVQPGSTGDGYALLISGDGYYTIQRITNGDYEPLVDWTTSGAIRQGNATNHIRAVCNGTYLALSVNGVLLAEANDATYASGDIALVAGTLETEPTEIHFDNLVVTVP